MPTFPGLRGGTIVTTIGANTATSGGTTVAADATINTKGAWVEFDPAIPFEAQGIYVFLRGSTLSCDSLFDIGIGAGGSEQPIVENVMFCMQALRVAAGVYIPITIPKGSRVSVRAQSTLTVAGALYTLMLISNGMKQAEGFNRAVTMGANTADSGGTEVDPGGTINTKGAYSEIVAASEIEIGWLVICIGNRNNGAVTTNVGLIDIAIGAAASEQVILANLAYCQDGGIDTPEPQYYGFPVSIPKGSRISARAQCSINDATDRLIDIVLIGLG